MSTQSEAYNNMDEALANAVGCMLNRLASISDYDRTLSVLVKYYLDKLDAKSSQVLHG